MGGGVQAGWASVPAAVGKQPRLPPPKLQPPGTAEERRKPHREEGERVQVGEASSRKSTKVPAPFPAAKASLPLPLLAGIPPELRSPLALAAAAATELGLGSRELKLRLAE
ncbi:unnamed protein product [Coccothraustes coccothraustes]